MFVFCELGVCIVAVDGPPGSCDHRYELIVPSLSVAVPARLTLLVGSVMLLSGPAFATGGLLVPLPLTVTVTRSNWLFNWSSFTVSLKVYVPAIRLLTEVVAAVEVPIVAVFGPPSC